MSNKNRRSRKAASQELAGSANEPSIDKFEITEIESGSVENSLPKGVFSYLRTHLWMVAIIGLLTLGVLGSTLKYLDEAAQRQIADRAKKGYLNDQEHTFLNKVNPFLPAPLPTGTPQLTKSYINGGGKMLAVEEPNAASASPADLAVWRPGTGYWWVMKPDGTTQASVAWGTSGDIPTEGDYDGDGKTDFCIFRPSTNQWWILKSSDNSYYYVTLGASGDLPAQADYDGDGKTDLAVFRPSTGTWYINQSSNSATVQGQFGLSTDIPTPKDFDGDGRADIAVWRSSNSTFYSTNSSNNQNQITSYSQTSAVPVPADYDGDGKADFAIRSGNDWIIKNSLNGQTDTITWQSGSDTAVPNDYDGDGKVDIAVWRNSNGNWYIRKSGSNGALRQQAWGTAGDKPVPVYYRR
jgi:hypothetical protein